MKSFAVSDRAERLCLGGMLRWNAVIADVAAVLRPEDFRSDSHQKLCKALFGLMGDGKPADLATVADVLYRDGALEDVGGYPYLAELWDDEPTGGNAVYHARIVRDHAIFRALEIAGNQIAAEAGNPSGSADDVLESAENQVFAIAINGAQSDTIPLAEAVAEATARIDARAVRGKGLSGLATGWMDLDGLTSGLQARELTVVAARPSVGKTAIGICLARHVGVDQGETVLFISLEQSQAELAERLLCCQARVDSHRIRRGYLNADEEDRLAEASRVLSKAKIFINDASEQGVLRVAAASRRVKLRHGLGLVVVDYLQLVAPEDRKANRQEQVAGISRRLKFLAKDLAVPVVALAQLNRGVEERSNQRPRLSDLRESGAIEQDSDTVILLHRGENDPSQPCCEIELIVAKQRNGPIGDVTLTFHKQFMRFENFAPGEVFA